MANGTTGLMGKSYGSSVVGSDGLFGSVSDFEKSFSFTPRPLGMGITPQEMQKKAGLLQEQQDKQKFFQDQEDRKEFLDFQREQEKQALKQNFLQQQTQEQAKTGALQGLENLYNSFTLFGQTPGEDQINQLRSYVQRNIASGILSEDDFIGLNKPSKMTPIVDLLRSQNMPRPKVATSVVGFEYPESPGVGFKYPESPGVGF